MPHALIAVALESVRKNTGMPKSQQESADSCIASLCFSAADSHDRA